MNTGESRPSKVTGDERIPELDAVRGLAALAVLITHLPFGFWLGEHGVDVFFVLSGFLITGIILRNRDQKGFLWNFYARRGLRIWPIYYVVIAGVLIFNGLRRHPEPTDGLAWYLAYLQNVWLYWGGVGHSMPHLGHTWTLAIEEQFYLIWPAVALGLSLGWAKRAAIVACLAPFLLRAMGLDRVTLLGHTDPLALGALLALFLHQRPREVTERASPWFAVLVVCGAVGYAATWRIVQGVGATGKELVASSPGIGFAGIFSLGLIGFVTLNSGSRPLAVLRAAPLRKLGEISYGLYLYHWVFYEVLDIKVKFGLGLGEPWWSDVVKVVGSVVIALVSWRYLEQPILRLKDRFAYRRNSAAPVTPSP